MRSLVSLLLLLVVMVVAPAPGYSAVDPPKYEAVMSDLGYNPVSVTPVEVAYTVTVTVIAEKQAATVKEVETLARDVGFSWQGIITYNSLTLNSEVAAESHKAGFAKLNLVSPSKQGRCLLQRRC